MTDRLRRTALALVAVTSLVLAGCGDDDDGGSATTTTEAEADATSTTDTTEAGTSGDGSTTSTTAAAEPDEPMAQPASAVWPYAADDLRYDDPVEAAQGFAVDYLGFVDPVVGEYLSGDSRSGEVSIQPLDQGPTTTVFVRQVTDDDSWWVIGAATSAIRLESPETMATITSPVSLSGQSTAFEATVSVEVRETGSTAPLTQDFVMGGANGEVGPFAKDIAFDAPTATTGALVLQTFSMEDGRIWEATVIPVSFG
jgi:hypothetical protein